jgi:hypothetical protein
MQTPNMRAKHKMKRYELSDYFLSLTTGEQISLLTNTGFKKGFWREPEKLSHYWMTYHFCLFNSEKERISYEFSFDVAIDIYDLKSWNDFDNLEVIDDDFGQPYYAFFRAQDSGHSFPFLDMIIKKYENQMSKLVEAKILKEVN